MKSWDFFGLVADKWVALITILIFILLFQSIFRKKYNISYLDPIGYQYILSLFALTVVLFLYFTEHISLKILVSVTLIGFSFYKGLGILPKYKNHFLLKDLTANFYPVLLCYIYFYILSVVFFGLPIFLDSRVELTSIESGNLRFISKFLNYFRPISLFLSFLLINHPLKKVRYLAWTAIFLASFEALTSGSKSGLIMFILFPSLILRIFPVELIPILSKNYRKMILIGVITIPIITTILYQNPSVLLYRAIMSGDIYYHVLPNFETWKENYSIGISAIFPTLAKLLGLVSVSSPGFNLGNDIAEFYYNVKNMGPTRRLPLYLFLNLGLIFAMLISFFAGRFLRYSTLKLSTKKVNGFYVFIWIPLFFSIYDIQSDYAFALSKALEVLIFGPMFLLTLKILRWHKSA